MNIFTYTIACDIAQLKQEINSSAITIAIDSIISENMDIIITFKTDISAEEEVILTGLIDAHVPIPRENDVINVALEGPKTPEGVSYTYNTSKPLDHYVCFQGAGDTATGVGEAEKLIFHLTSKTQEVVKEFTFNEGVYIKDGYIISKEAPFGASLDIEIVHPVYGIVVNAFGKRVPVFGTGWFPLDTEDRAFVPKGMIIRITVHNSNGGNDEGDSPDEQSPADFWISGRFELYRKINYQ